ncbi:hypothetical protein AFLA_012826 [Aspergillus flavus NRRL3357]|nr:hypothetical protein AFLA_012826 [Aspergillus flavus NRRL3357]
MVHSPPVGDWTVTVTLPCSLDWILSSGTLTILGCFAAAPPFLPLLSPFQLSSHFLYLKDTETGRGKRKRKVKDLQAFFLST